MKNSPLWIALQHLKFKLVVALKPRKNRTYTQFHRFLHQYDVLEHKVLPFLLSQPKEANAEPLKIILFGCSLGAEPYSLISVLQHRFPKLNFQIRAFDIVPEVVARAQSREYDRTEVYNCPFITEEFVTRTFDLKPDGKYLVKDHIASRVSFAVASILDEALIESLGQADMVFAQNMLFHLKPSLAKIGFGHLVKMMKPKSALMVDGMDTGMRVELTKKFNLEPVDFKTEEVHQDAFIDRGNNWASFYWGREPFSKDDAEWLRKFGTVYLRKES